MTRKVRIGNGQGFWGDSPDAAVDLVTRGPVDYVGLDYLAEVTLSIMMRQRLRDPAKGYASDFIGFLRRVLPVIATRGIRVVTNAGGLNPAACREEVFKLARELGILGLRVGIVEGDDLLPRLGEFCALGHHLEHMETGQRLCDVRHKVLSANAYLGARPVAEALGQGAQIVLAGRITDTALALGPLIHEFGWGADDWDRLAAGTVAGHIIECGAQCTGGNFSRWWEVPELWDVGYPIVECAEDGCFTVTKHPGTGGMVTTGTVAEQLVYEMGDPSTYITPDCVADFGPIRLALEGPDRVRVDSVRGRPATPFYKVSASFHEGYKATGQLVVSGPRAVEKARLAAEIVWKRLEKAGVRFPDQDRIVELLGTGVCHRGVVEEPADPPEVVLRLGVRAPSAHAVARFGMELAPLVTSGPPGVTGFAGGRPKPQEVVAYWPALVPKTLVDPQVRVSVEMV
ncbi:MAG: acyclic terpene utilization AtuA family protein [Acidobacteriota bacterium]